MSEPTHAPAPSGLGRLASADAAAITQRTALLSVAVALALIALKGWAWLASGSVAMLATLADSALDLAASAVSYFAVRYAAAPPDAEHRFGHGKAEAFAGLFQAGLVALSAVLLVVESGSRLLEPAPLQQGSLAIGVMLASTALTGLLIYAQTRALRQTGSVATAGDRAHYASDFAANAVVIVGLAASAWLGWTWADAAGGIGVAVLLAFSAWHVATDSADHLMDKELPDADRARIGALAQADPAVRGVHDLRTRASGPYIHIQFHADLDPSLTLEAAHKIVVAAEDRIRAEFPAADVIIHPDPGDRAEPHGHELFEERRDTR
jgi:cation diffusion facilitator family transporter